MSDKEVKETQKEQQDKEKEKKMEEYFHNLEKEVNKTYEVVNEARGKGLDPVKEADVPIAKSLAEKVVGLVSALYPQLLDKGVSERIKELEEKWGKLDPAICLQIAEDTARERFCKFDSLMQGIDAGARLGLAYITLGVVSSPIEGLTEIKLMKTKDGKEYFCPYYSGPIRSAGGTGASFSLVIIDHLRETFGYAEYDPDEDEVNRMVTELTDYHERVTNLQYMPTQDEIKALAGKIPVQVSGEASEKIEVSNYKNLDRVETDFIRSGLCLVFGEGLAQKAAKIKRYVKALREKGFKLTNWDFLEDYLEIHEKRESGEDSGGGDTRPTYIQDLVAGRPVFGHPSRSGAFRFRYGRSRVSGFSAASAHPATMAITDGFIAMGTQIKIEKPTKGTALTSNDYIEGPIVKLKNGSVRKVEDMEEAKKLYSKTSEILYLGDMLFPFSDLANRNHDLIKPGYVEEWWKLELEEILYESQDKNTEETKKIDEFNISFEQAIDLSRKYGVPLHPDYIFFWNQISKDQFLGMINWLKHGKVSSGKGVLPYNREEQEKFASGKRALEIAGIEHEVTTENVVLSNDRSRALFVNLGLDLSLLEDYNSSGNSQESNDGGNGEPTFNEIPLNDVINFEKFKEKIEEITSKGNEENSEENKKEEGRDNSGNIDDPEGVLRTINEFSEFVIKDRAGEFIGTRMGRPEKAKLRKLQGSPNVLFPVGQEGGKMRTIQAACEKGKVNADLPLFYCENCEKETVYPLCEDCENETKQEYFFPDTKEKSFNKEREDGQEGKTHCERNININHYVEKARNKLNLAKTDLPNPVKGVKGVTSDDKTCENLAKGILRARNSLHVNKDGSIRFDATEMPLTAFRPREVYVSVEKLKSLGYDKDINGNPLENEEQLLELKPHDVLLPSTPDTLDERADNVFTRICNFVDEELKELYGMEGFFNIKSKEDLVGHLGACMAPHNCGGVVCRFIGFSNTQGIVASPYMHAAIRRDCDGDEAGIMLLADVLLNFSKRFLPSHRGGTQDAPLVLNSKIDPGEVDDQILDFELTPEGHYPLKLYKLAEERKHSSEIDREIPTVKSIMKEEKNPFINMGFTHDTSDFNKGIACSAYKNLGAMEEKIGHQMDFDSKVRAVDAGDTARLIIERHFLRDLRGNLRSFSTQDFRCVDCNEIYRRPPLKGKCTKCGGKLIFTIHEGGIKKYLDPALDLANTYDVSNYLKQNLELTKRYIDSIFGKEPDKQEALEKWF